MTMKCQFETEKYLFSKQTNKQKTITQYLTVSFPPPRRDLLGVGFFVVVWCDFLFVCLYLVSKFNIASKLIVE